MVKFIILDFDRIFPGVMLLVSFLVWFCVNFNLVVWMYYI